MILGWTQNMVFNKRNQMREKWAASASNSAARLILQVEDAQKAMSLLGQRIEWLTLRI